MELGFSCCVSSDVWFFAIAMVLGSGRPIQPGEQARAARQGGQCSVAWAVREEQTALAPHDQQKTERAWLDPQRHALRNAVAGSAELL